MCDINSFVLTATVAQMKRVTPATIRNWADAGKLPYVRTLEGTRLFRLEDVEALDGGLSASNTASASIISAARRDDPVAV